MRRWVPAILAVALLAPAAAFPQADNGTQNSKGAVYEQLNLFDEAFERIRQDAVEAVGDKQLVSTAIAGMLSSLDPHAVYLTEAQYKAQQAPSKEEQGAIGLVVTIANGQLTVVSPRDGSPAAAAGIKPGDEIFMIGKEPTYDMTLADIAQRLHGPVGSEVTLLLRRGTEPPMKLTVKRADSAFQTVSSRLDEGDIGYIRLGGFDDKTAGDLAAAVANLRQQSGNKLIGFVLDLRNNPGGDFKAAVTTADDFLDKGDVAVIKGRNPADDKRIAATPGDLAKGLPIVAIINGGTAGEAELVAGALHDNHRAVLLGSKTFGESGIETTIPLDGGNGAIRLTTARFLTPDGNEIQGKGIQPDLAVSSLKIEKIASGEQVREADLPGALKNTDTIIPPAHPSAAPGNTKPSAAPKPSAGAPAAATKPETNEPVASKDIGTAEDEQLTEALDVLRGLAMTSARNTR